MQDDSIYSADFGIPLEARTETLEIEFKRELDLRAPEGKAKLAQEIAAICNHGGGWIVLGREDGGEYPPVLPDCLVGIDQDTVNQIASAYLTPSPNCALAWIKPSEIGYQVPVIRIPSVAAIPVCAKKNGPQDDKHRIIGVRQGVHYIRAAGPVSAPIASPDQWQDLIRRCVLNDKTALLAALSAMVNSPSETVNPKSLLLDSDFEALTQEWKRKASKLTHNVALDDNFIAFGFELLSPEGAIKVSSSDIERFLSQRPYHHYGPMQFFQNVRRGSSTPYFLERSGVGGLEADLLDSEGTFAPDQASIWRISEACCAVEVFSFWEDTSHLKHAVASRSTRNWEGAQNVWPAIQMEYVDGFLSFISDFVSFLGFSGKVRFRAHYEGLAGRSLNSPRMSMTYSRNYTSRQGSKDIDLTLDVNALSVEVRSAAIAIIIQSLNKLFQGPEITSASVVRTLEAHRRE